MVFVEGKGEGEFMNKIEVIPSLLIILMGSIDCVTTILGVVYSGRQRSEPCYGGHSQHQRRRILSRQDWSHNIHSCNLHFREENPDGDAQPRRQSLHLLNKALTFAYAGLIGFLTLTVANNLLILIK